MVPFDAVASFAGLTEATPTVLIREHRGTVDELHAIPMPTEGDTAELWMMRPNAPAVAMGSAQRPDRFEGERLRQDGVQLAARRSGGGAVFIEPRSTVWIDLLAPRTTHWYSAELTENFMLVGRRWQNALVSLGIDTELCDRSEGRSPASAVACWAGLGWGELTIDGAKVVGLSQRRTRWGSRVQALAVLDRSSARVADYLGADDRAVLGDSIRGVEVDVRPDAVEAAVLAAFLTD